MRSKCDQSPNLVSFTESNISLSWDFSIWLGCVMKHTLNPLPHKGLYIMHLRAPCISWIFLPLIFIISKPKFLQQYASAFLNNKKKANTFLWLTFQIWPRVLTTPLIAMPGTLGVTFQPYFSFLCPIYGISVHSHPKFNTSKKWKSVVKREYEMGSVLNGKYISSFQFIDLLRATTMRNNSNLLSIHINNRRRVLFQCISFVVA